METGRFIITDDYWINVIHRESQVLLGLALFCEILFLSYTAALLHALEIIIMDTLKHFKCK